MINTIFGVILGFSLLFGLLRGRGAELSASLLAAAGEAVTLAISLTGGFAFFCGLIEILRRAGATAFLSRALSKPLGKLLGDAPEDAKEAVAMNLAANMLGMGNAATPMGLEAMRRMDAALPGARASNAMCVFLVANASSIQLYPTTIVALRASYGAQNPGAVVIPILIVSCVSALAGVLACKLMQRWT